MTCVLTESDYRPIEGYPFQRWGERTGRPFRDIRPLSEAAAARVWKRTLRIHAADWDGPIPHDAYPRRRALDLSGADWTEESVRGWLMDTVPAADDEPVLVSYAPQWAVTVDWSVLCEYWLTFFWTAAAVRVPDERWVLYQADDRLAFGGRE